MTQTASRPQELALPVASLAALRRTLDSSVGEAAAAVALQQAGVAAGDAFYDMLALAPVAGDSPPADWSDGTFWRRFGELFERRGWGRIANEEAHPGVGALNAFDWVESVRDMGAGRPSCFFTAGLLAKLLGRICNEEVAVLEVECRSKGDARCRFLYGSPDTLDAVYDRVRAGEDAGETLATLS